MFELTIVGADELVRNLRQLPQDVAGKVLRKALKNAGAQVAERASTLAPRSAAPGPSGHMADSIGVRSLKVEEGDADLEVNLAIGPDKDHFWGLFSEFGTKHERATPFLRPAWDGLREQVLTDFAANMTIEIERAVKRLTG